MGSLNEAMDGVFQFGCEAMDFVPDLFFGPGREPALHQIELESADGREVHRKAWMRGQPTRDEWCSVRAVIIQDQVHVQFAGNGGLDAVQEFPELDRAVRDVKSYHHP